jgi:ABC-type metal ion transport system substrate-binding protein
VITVSYDGKSFSIPRDSNRGGRTLQVLELVKQLLALNTSARQLPSTSVLSVVGGSAQ